MRWRFCAWSLVILLTPMVAAVNPLDNDGGSAGDAGDAARLAKPVAPGTFTGRMMPPVDVHDYYSFSGQRGQLLRATFTSSPNPVVPGMALMNLQEAIFAWLYVGVEGTFLLPYTGTYLFWVAGPLAGANVDYQLTWSLQTPGDSFSSFSPASWQTAEARWSQRTTMKAYAWTDRNDATTAPSAQFVMVEWFGDGPGRIGWFSFHYSTTGTGHRIVVSPINSGLASQLTWNVTAGSLSLAFNDFTSDYGSMRLTVYNTDPRAHTALTFAGTAPFERAATQGDNVLVWSDSNAGASSQTQLPGYAVTGPRDLTLQVGSRFVGDFETWGHEGWATSPTNQRYYGSRSFIPLANPGTWRFHLGQTSGVGQQADRIYLDGVFAPALGLAKQWTCGPLGCTAG